MGYSKECNVAWSFCDARLARIAPAGRESVLNYMGSDVLQVPKLLTLARGRRVQLVYCAAKESGAR
jgi:hypothetical protein